MQAKDIPNVVFYSRAGTAEDSDPSGWVVAHSPDGLQVTRQFGVFPSEARAQAKLREIRNEALTRSLYEAKDAIQLVMDNWPEEAYGSGKLEEAMELIGDCADEFDPTVGGES